MSRTTHTSCQLPLLGLMTVALLGSASVVADEASADAKLEAARVKINAMFQEISPENVTLSPVDGWYTVHKGAIIAYVSGDGRYLLQGDMIDLDTQVNLSEQARTDSRREVMSRLSDDDAIMFSPAEVKHRVTVFTDVDCTYCRKLHSQMDEYLAQGIEIRYLLYPRGGPASRSWNTSEEVWCARDRNSALTAAKLDRDFESNKCDASAITRHYMLGQDIGLTGTPAIVFEDGTLLSGYLPPAALTSRLQLTEQAAANN
jgi:thiol:disulfide interchange protein DsbC